MPIKQATPYLFFNGTAEQAVRLYERALGAKTEGLMRYGDTPQTAQNCRPEDLQRVMHAVLHLGEAQVMVSDVTADRPQRTGGHVDIVLEFDDVEEMTRRFEALAASGTVQMPLHDTFWGAKFGALTDELGIAWMFNCTTKAT